MKSAREQQVSSGTERAENPKQRDPVPRKGSLVVELRGFEPLTP